MLGDVIGDREPVVGHPISIPVFLFCWHCTLLKLPIPRPEIASKVWLVKRPAEHAVSVVNASQTFFCAPNNDAPGASRFLLNASHLLSPDCYCVPLLLSPDLPKSYNKLQELSSRARDSLEKVLEEALACVMVIASIS